MSRLINGLAGQDHSEFPLRSIEEELELEEPEKKSVHISPLAFLHSALPAPVNFRTESRSPTTTALFWENSHVAGGAATGIEIHRALGDGSFSLIDTVDDLITAYNDTGLAIGTRYRYKIRVV